MTRLAQLRTLFAAALGLGIAALATPASAGVATAGAVLLDPFDPVPEIQFHHFGGYGCGYDCGYSGGCADTCGGYSGCNDGCRRHYRRHDCEDGCYRRAHYDCDDNCRRHDDCHDNCGRRDDCEHDCDREAHEDAPPPAQTCTSASCYDAEHYERRWRDGDKVGQEWMDRGRREKVISDHGGPGGYYGHENYDWHDDDAPPPPPPPMQGPGCGGHGHH